MARESTGSRLPAAVEAFRHGELVVVVDDEERENEGDLICAASRVTARQIAFMVRFTTGIVCVPMSAAALRRLDLPQMTTENEESMRTAFAVSVDARVGVTTGVSAVERARTIQVLADPRSRPHDLVRPGHVFPLRAHPGGVLARRGHTEATLELARLAGLPPVGALAELVNDDGTMMRWPQIQVFAELHRLALVTVGEIADAAARAAAASARVGERDSFSV